MWIKGGRGDLIIEWKVYIDQFGMTKNSDSCKRKPVTAVEGRDNWSTGVIADGFRSEEEVPVSQVSDVTQRL